MHTHSTRDDRAVISDGLRRGESYAAIGDRIGKDKSSVSREVARNQDPDGRYDARRADKRAQERRKMSKHGARRIENDAALADEIESQLHPLVSPEVVAHEVGIVHETIYQWISRSRPDLKAKLPQRGRKRRRYGSKREAKQGWTRHVRSIDAQPAGARNRSRTGHLEGDTVRGTNGALLTHADRKSRFALVDLVPNEGADAAHARIAERFGGAGVRSITYDRGSTFALWRMIEKATGAKVYFAHPRAPWERGTNENMNGRLRRVFPKRFDFSTITQRDVDAIVWIMNHTKRKCLGWRTPCEVYGKCCNSK
jgi:IS30 family transposase